MNIKTLNDISAIIYNLEEDGLSSEANLLNRSFMRLAAIQEQESINALDILRRLDNVSTKLEQAGFYKEAAKTNEVFVKLAQWPSFRHKDSQESTSVDQQKETARAAVLTYLTTFLPALQKAIGPTEQPEAVKLEKKEQVIVQIGQQLKNTLVEQLKTLPEAAISAILDSVDAFLYSYEGGEYNWIIEQSTKIVDFQLDKNPQQTAQHGWQGSGGYSADDGNRGGYMYPGAYEN